MKTYLTLGFVGLLAVNLLYPAHAQFGAKRQNPFGTFDRSRGVENKPTPAVANQPVQDVTEKDAALRLNKRRPFGVGEKAGEIKVNPIDGAQMVWVPAGAFLMGSKASDKQAKANEKPQHKVHLRVCIQSLLSMSRIMAMRIHAF